MAKLLLVSGDLMIVSRLQGVATSCGLSLIQASTPSAATEACDAECVIAIVDLQTPGLVIANLVDQLNERNPKIAIIAAGPHVHEDRLEAARQADCTAVVSRGQLDRDAQQLIATMLQQG